MKIISIIIILFTFTNILIAKPSWCSGARSTVEKRICNNDNLSEYDSEITKVYRSAKNKLYGADKKRLVKAQRKWIHKRNQCRTTECIERSYRERIAQLQNHYNLTQTPHTSGTSSNKVGVVYGLDPDGDGFLSLRTKPTGREIGKLYESDKLKILAKRGKWYKVKTVSTGQVGWVHGNWVKISNAIMSHNKESSSVSTSGDWWSIFKLNRKTIARKYPDLSLETINKMAKSDTLKECKDYDVRSKVKQLIKTQLMVEPLEFAKNRYDDYKRKMSKDTMDKLYFYEMVLGLRLTGEEMELISKYNPGGLMDSMSYLDDCAYNNNCYSIATNLTTLHLPEKIKKISKDELRIIDEMIIKFLKRGCNNTLQKYSDCSNSNKNGCYGYSCSLLASIYGGVHDLFSDSKKNIDEALKISQNMCYDKNNANNCGVLGSILVAKGTKHYQKAKHAFKQGCTLTNNREKDSGNICLWCCESYKDLINKGW